MIKNTNKSIDCLKAQGAKVSTVTVAPIFSGGNAVNYANVNAVLVTESTVGFEPLTFTKPWMDTNLRFDRDTPMPIITGAPQKMTEPSGW